VLPLNDAEARPAPRGTYGKSKRVGFPLLDGIQQCADDRFAVGSGLLS
jgi:hypothetical protein